MIQTLMKTNGKCKMKMTRTISPRTTLMEVKTRLAGDKEKRLMEKEMMVLSLITTFRIKTITDNNMMLWKPIEGHLSRQTGN